MSLPIDHNHNHLDEDFLNLSLSIGSRPQSPSLHQQHEHSLSQQFQLLTVTPPPSPTPCIYMPPPSSYIPRPENTTGASHPPRARSSQALKQGKTETIPAPYPWATARRATVHSLEHLLSNGMNKVSGQVQCQRCDRQYSVEFDLRQKFMEIASFISKNKYRMHDRAPTNWMSPTLLDCKLCDQRNCVKPVATKKRSINWLFLLLGQFLGFCKLSELKYFCKHTNNHRTGAKDRVLYITYLGLCKQLDPAGPFDVAKPWVQPLH